MSLCLFKSRRTSKQRDEWQKTLFMLTHQCFSHFKRHCFPSAGRGSRRHAFSHTHGIVWECVHAAPEGRCRRREDEKAGGGSPAQNKAKFHALRTPPWAEDVLSLRAHEKFILSLRFVCLSILFSESSRTRRDQYIFAIGDVRRAFQGLFSKWGALTLQGKAKPNIKAASSLMGTLPREINLSGTRQMGAKLTDTGVVFRKKNSIFWQAAKLIGASSIFYFLGLCCLMFYCLPLNYLS